MVGTPDPNIYTYSGLSFSPASLYSPGQLACSFVRSTHRPTYLMIEWLRNYALAAHEYWSTQVSYFPLARLPAPTPSLNCPSLRKGNRPLPHPVNLRKLVPGLSAPSGENQKKPTTPACLYEHTSAATPPPTDRPQPNNQNKQTQRHSFLPPKPWPGLARSCPR